MLMMGFYSLHNISNLLLQNRELKWVQTQSSIQSPVRRGMVHPMDGAVDINALERRGKRQSNLCDLSHVLRGLCKKQNHE